MAENPWTLEEGRNPYCNTPFQVLDLEVDDRGRAAIHAKISKRRQRIHNTPERFPLFGRILTDAEVTAAEAQVKNPEGRLYAELCMHRPRSSSIDVRALIDRLARLPAPEDQPFVTLDRRRLARLLPPPTSWRFPPLEAP